MSTTSRRSFLKTIGVAAAAPGLTGAEAPVAAAESPASRPARFAPRDSLKKLSDNLFFLEDTCNVYLVKDGARGLLIDFGSGKILDYLADVGVSQVDWVLHTHHHRDQCH